MKRLLQEDTDVVSEVPVRMPGLLGACQDLLAEGATTRNQGGKCAAPFPLPQRHTLAAKSGLSLIFSPMCGSQSLRGSLGQ